MPTVNSIIDAVTSDFKSRAAPVGVFDRMVVMTKKLNNDLEQLDSDSTAQSLAKVIPERKKQEQLAQSYQQIENFTKSLQKLTGLIRSKLIDPLMRTPAQS